MTAINARAMGCKTCTPFASAIAPTANGKRAAPPPPKAAANPIALTCSLCGKSLVATTIAAGNNGPRKNPNHPAKTALEIKYGINQKHNSNAMAMSKYAAMAVFSPILPVTKPKMTRPKVIPS